MLIRLAVIIVIGSLGGFSQEPARDIERTVTLLSKIGFSRSPSFSPDGSRVAFLSNISGSPQIWTAPIKNGWPAKMTSFPDPVLRVLWSPTADRLAFTVAPGGGMNTQVYLVGGDGRGRRRITPDGKVNNYLTTWSHDGRYLAYSSNRRRADAMEAYTYEPKTGGNRLRVRAPGLALLTDISRDGRWAVAYRMASRSDDNLYLVNLRTGKQTLLTPHTPPGSFGGGILSPNGRRVYLSTNKGRDRIALARLDLGEDGAPGDMEVIAERGDAELEEFSVTEDGTTAALLWNVAGKSELAFLDLESGEPTPGPDLPAAVASGPTFSRDGRFLALTISGPTAPRDIWVYERESARLLQLTMSPHAGVDLERLIRPRLVRFRSYDGVELSAWLYRPREASGPGPVVLSFHGGPEKQELPAFRSDYQALLASGISVFAPNVRGSSGFGKRFVNMDNGALRWNAIRDIKACVDFLRREGVADPKRIGIVGSSYGGYMVMAGLTEYPELFAAGADLFGLVNFETFFKNTEPWMAAISRVEYGDPETQQDMLRALSPIYKIDRVRAPTLVLHGANDTNVSVAEAEQVVANLKERGVPVEYILFEGEGHGFRQTRNRIRSALAVVRWFDKYLNQ